MSFHSDMGPHHGLTVVIDTNGTMAFAGQCHQELDDKIILTNAEFVDTEDAGSETKEDFVSRVVRMGVMNKVPTLTIQREDVASFKLLKDLM